MSVHSQIDPSASSVAPQGGALRIVPPLNECRTYSGGLFWRDAEGKVCTASYGEHAAAWAAQQAAQEQDLRFHLPCELEEDGAGEGDGDGAEDGERRSGGDLSPGGHSPEPNSHKSHPAGRGWIAAGRDIGLPGEGPDAEQAAFGDGGFAGAGSPPSSSPRRQGPGVPCAEGEDRVSAFAGMTAGEPAGGATSPLLYGEEGHLPHTTFTPERQMRFCDRLAACGNVRMACALSGISAMTAYRARRRDSLFAEVWDRALALARDHAEAVLAVRALEGIAEPVFHHGEVVGHRRRYDSKLLLAHLARLDRRCEALDARARHGAPDDGEAFDLLLARLGGLEEAEDALPARDTHIEQAGAEAERAALQDAFPGDSGDEDFEPGSEPDKPDLAPDEDEESEGEDATDWDGTGPDPILVAGQEARARAGEEWDEAHAALCMRIDVLCARIDDLDEDAEEVNPLPENLPYEIKSWPASAAKAGSAAKGCVTGVTGGPAAAARMQASAVRPFSLYCQVAGV
ncbi:MAG TPA: hypothetical protein VL094_06425 [Sphingomonadaceae bacterium]|nr:hypothetical protein [Sphingomonadaceae bacterium]